MGAVDARELHPDALTAKASAGYGCLVRERRRRDRCSAGNVKRLNKYSVIGICVCVAEGHGLWINEIADRDILSLAEH